MKVSTCRTKITPQGAFFPCYLMGHAIRTEKAAGILHDLWATALVLNVDGVQLVWVTVELIGLPRELTDRLCCRISKKYGVPADAVNLSYVHTHSAPEYDDPEFKGFGEGAVPGYTDWVERQILAAVDGCFSAGFIETELIMKKLEISGCYGNRNGREKPCDKSFVTLEFRAADRVVAGACSFACHSTVLGPQNLLVSSDLAGHLARHLQEKWGVYPIVMIGAAGDMSNRLYRQGNDAAELERVGGEILEQVFSEDVKEQKLTLSRPKIRTFRYEETFCPDHAKKQLQYDTIKEKIANARTFDEKKVYTSALRMAEINLNKNRAFPFDLEGRYLDLGDLRLFIIPAELFSRFGIRIKEAMGGKCPICWCYSNYSVGYLGNISDYGDNFETSASDIPPGTTEKVVEKIIGFVQCCNQEEGTAP
ncbi:hypothetical protein [Caproicibacter fermentans]|uniref:Neutral/alkaline non-lysosomal ceramidase N-terminal domain-containing protein n=1 Tax=Caproicibacter fermentans TaxID=2576756 RepID=A0A7G8T654_9FIRM|nr:hypothetical protein [Caproicibacter fermentans]QNK39095.1 hypothetical protein HCR03_09830 [Caproicibacter fermentans]